eukprot:4411_1
MAASLEIVEEVSEGILAIILIVTGIIILLWGAKLLKWILFIMGFVAGTLLTYAIIHNAGLPDSSPVIRYSIFIAIAVGICVGVLAIFVYNAAVFIAGAICGIIIAQLLWHFITTFVDMPQKTSEIVNIVLVLVFAIIFGFLAFKFMKFIAKPITSFIGSFMTTSGIAYYIQRYAVKDFDNNLMDITQYFNSSNQCDMYCWIFIGIWIVLFIIGMLYQYEVCKQAGHIKLANIEDELTADPNNNDDDEEQLIQRVEV